MTDYLRCPSCNMTFKSSLLLEKHRAKFCIGGDVGRVRETQTPVDMVYRLRNFRKTQDNQQQQHKLKEINEDKTTNQTMDPNKSTMDSGQSDKPYKFERKTSDQESQLRQLAEAHSKQINDILHQNKLLEKQRDDIVQRLNEISAQNRNTGYLEKMIKYLADQEQKNEQLLATMKQQIDMLQLEAMKKALQSRHTGPPASQRIEKVQQPIQHAYIPFFGGGSLFSEISALRLTYLKNGGNDQMILAHLQDLLTEAQLIERQEKRPRPIRKKPKTEHGPVNRHMSDRLINLEMENQQLEDQLFRLQLQRQKNSRLPRTTHVAEKSVQLPRFIKEQTRHNIKTLNAELEVLKQELEIQKLKRRIKTSATRRVNPKASSVFPLAEGKPDTPELPKHLLNFSQGLDPAPYDPISGFVVFYDYLLGLDPTYRVCRLSVTLCSGGLEMGSPSPLPPVYCETSSSKLHEYKNQNIAILATKQAVPRVRPSSNISLIIELQASGGYDPYGQEISRLIPRGWVKIDIFDSQNRVISGHWKIPIRILPVKPSLTTGALNGVPQLENTELHIRLVNARDADAQSLYSIEINNSMFYKYPPLTAAYIYQEELLQPLPYYSSFLTPNMQPAYRDIVDSPPSRNNIMTQ